MTRLEQDTLRRKLFNADMRLAKDACLIMRAAMRRRRLAVNLLPWRPE